MFFILFDYTFVILCKNNTLLLNNKKLIHLFKFYKKKTKSNLFCFTYLSNSLSSYRQKKHTSNKNTTLRFYLPQ